MEVIVTRVRDFVRVEAGSMGFTMINSEAWQLLADLAIALGATVNGVAAPSAEDAEEVAVDKMIARVKRIMAKGFDFDEALDMVKLTMSYNW